MTRTLLTTLLLALTLCGSHADEAKGSELKVGSLEIKMPAPWALKTEPRRMSEGGFTLAGKAGEAPVEADFYFFGQGGGGGVEANVQRWQGQFTPDADGKPAAMERGEFTVGEHKAILITIKGTFLSGGAMSPNKTPMPGYAMIGVILQNAGGDVFVKVTGPEAATLATKEQVREMAKAALSK